MGVPLARALLPSGRAVLADLLEAALEQRDLAARDPAVGLELRLAGAARADAGAERTGAAAEALEVLPHPAHPRQVVLELRELDLELSLGALRVLREDVEDQLRPVDDASRQRVLERLLLRRLQLVVDDQHLGARLARRPASAPRACPCRCTCADPGSPAAARARRSARRPPYARARAARRAPARRRRTLGARPGRARARARRPSWSSGASSLPGLCHACRR